MATKTVVVTKTGTPAYVGGIATARGEGETASVLQHLIDRGDVRVVYFGSCRGYENWGPYTSGQLIVMDPSMTGIFSGNETPRFSDAAPMAERIDPYIAQLLEHDVSCWLDMTGPEVSWSWPANPRWASCLLWSARYSGPAKYAMHQVFQKQRAPRFCIVTDPKCYPRDGEMATGWDGLKPRAVLSQETTTFDRTLMEKYCKIKTVYAACEYWLTEGFDRVERVKRLDLAIAANGHLTDARVGGRGKGRCSESKRYQAWSGVLEQCNPNQTRICGAGWENHAYQTDPERSQMFVGVLPDLNAVLDHIASGFGSPVLPQKRGFNTTKPRLHALCDSVPYLYTGSEGTLYYDIDERILPMNHPARWVDKMPKLTAEQHREAVDLVLRNTTPDFSKLDHLVDRAIANDNMMYDYRNEDWVNTFGGYVFG